MRHAGLLLLGLVLLALAGACGRVLHLEWLRPDPVLLLDVFIALHLATLEGVTIVFVLGLFADSFAGTPVGMLTAAHLATWLLMRGARQLLSSDEGMVLFGAVFVMGLIYQILVLAELALQDAPPGLLWLAAKAVLPLGLSYLALCLPVLPVARWIWRSGSQGALARAGGSGSLRSLR